jgi:hypothetical protein
MSKLLARKPRQKKPTRLTRELADMKKGIDLVKKLIYDEASSSYKTEKALSKSKSQYKPSETQICIALVDYVARVHPDLSEDFIHISNENRCSWAEGKKLKSMGKRAGVSDYFLAHPKFREIQKPLIIGSETTGYRKSEAFVTLTYKPSYFGLWLEIKSERGKETALQRKFGQRQIENGYAYEVVHSLEEGIAAIENYLKA